MRSGLALLLIAACNAQIGNGGAGIPDGPKPPVDGSSDIDAPTPPPDGLGAWSTPLKIPGASGALDEDDGTLSSNTLELIFAAVDPADGNRKHLYAITRANAQTMVWTPPERLSFNVTGATDQTPRLSDNQLTLYFASTRPGGVGNLDIWQVTRAQVGGTWDLPTLVPGVNSVQTEKTLSPCDGDRYLVISNRDGASNVYEGVLNAGAPKLVSELSSPQGETGTFLTKDCLTAYFASSRGGMNMIWTATRSAPGAIWQPPAMVTDFVATGGAQEDPWLSPDQRTFLFSSLIGNKDVYITTR